MPYPPRVSGWHGMMWQGRRTWATKGASSAPASTPGTHPHHKTLYCWHRNPGLAGAPPTSPRTCARLGTTRCPSSTTRAPSPSSAWSAKSGTGTQLGRPMTCRRVGRRVRAREGSFRRARCKNAAPVASSARLACTPAGRRGHAPCWKRCLAHTPASKLGTSKQQARAAIARAAPPSSCRRRPLSS